jgi:hypothetical protein
VPGAPAGRRAHGVKPNKPPCDQGSTLYEMQSGFGISQASPLNLCTSLLDFQCNHQYPLSPDFYCPLRTLPFHVLAIEYQQGPRTLNINRFMGEAFGVDCKLERSVTGIV